MEEKYICINFKLPLFFFLSKTMRMYFLTRMSNFHKLFFNCGRH